MKNRELCIWMLGNPPVLMRRPAIFNLETGPSFNPGRVTTHGGPVKTKDIRNNEQRHKEELSSVASELRRIQTNKQTHVNTDAAGLTSVCPAASCKPAARFRQNSTLVIVRAGNIQVEINGSSR